MTTIEKSRHRRSLGDQQVDRELAAAARDGDREAFEQLYTIYADKLYRFAVRRVRDHDTAMDVVSDTFLKALRAFSGDSSATAPAREIAGWLFTTATNLIIDMMRSSRRRDVLVCEVPDRVSDEWCPAEAVIDRETSRELQGHVAALRDGRRRVVELRFWGELTIKETAAVMGRSETAVKALMFKAIRELTYVYVGPAPRGTDPKVSGG